jgi:hypothetical protein
MVTVCEKKRQRRTETRGTSDIFPQDNLEHKFITLETVSAVCRAQQVSSSGSFNARKLMQYERDAVRYL